METILVHNQCLNLGAAEYNYNYNSMEKGVDLSIPITAKLLEYLKLCGVQTELTVGEVFHGPFIWIGFSIRSLHDNPDSPKGYLDVYPADKFRNDVIGVEFLKENVVILKLDIESVINYDIGMALKPRVLSRKYPFLLSNALDQLPH